MRNWTSLIVFIFIALSFELFAYNYKVVQFENKKTEIVPNSILVIFKEKSSKNSNDLFEIFSNYVKQNKKFWKTDLSKKDLNEVVKISEIVQLKNQSIFDIRLDNQVFLVNETALIEDIKKSNNDIDIIQPNFIYHKMDLINPIPYIWENKIREDIKAQKESESEMSYTWNMQSLNIPKAHEYLTQKNLWNKKIKIAVLDTGIYGKNPYLPSWENAFNIFHVFYYSGAKTYQSKNEYEPPMQGYRLNDETGNWEDYEVVGGYHDWAGHGTHCTGMVAGKTTPEKNFTGVAPGYTIIPVKILDDEGSGSTGEILQGVIYAVKQGAHVLSMSLGGSSYDRVSEKVYKEEAYDKGVPVVAAAGNSYEQGNPDSYPGAFPTVISVASLGSDDFISYFSQSHDWVDIAASGGDGYKPNRKGSQRQVLSTWTNDSRAPRHNFSTKPEPFEDRKLLAGISGTSMATPQIAGLVALIRGINLKLTPDQIKTLLQDTGVRVLGGYYPKQLTLSRGLKKADAFAAVKEASEGNGGGQDGPGESSDWSQLYVETPSDFPTKRLYWIKAYLKLSYTEESEYAPPGKTKQDLTEVDGDTPLLDFSKSLSPESIDSKVSLQIDFIADSFIPLRSIYLKGLFSQKEYLIYAENRKEPFYYLKLIPDFSKKSFKIKVEYQ